MRALVIVHEKDLEEVSSLATSDGQLIGEIWDIENCVFEFCKFCVGSERSGALADTADNPVSTDEIALRYSVIILIAARHAANDQRLLRILTDFLRGAGSSAWSNETVIVLSVAQTAMTGLRNLPSQRVFFAPSDSLPEPPKFKSEDWTRQVYSDLELLSRMIDENQTRSPNVGFGMLLVDRNCNCFLMERLRDPERKKLGTIGGNFERGHTLVEGLATVLERRFPRGRGPEVDLGPLLSCTNMKNDFLHYIDLTFLAVVKSGGLGHIFDPDLGPLGRETTDFLDSENSGQRGSEPSGIRRMFTLPEVAVFYRADRLFTPVENAFEALCRTIYTEQLRHGPRRKVFLPSLLDEGRMLELDLPEDPDTIRRIVAHMDSSRNALPFFESGIS